MGFLLLVHIWLLLSLHKYPTYVSSKYSRYFKTQSVSSTESYGFFYERIQLLSVSPYNAIESELLCEVVFWYLLPCHPYTRGSNHGCDWFITFHWTCQNVSNINFLISSWNSKKSIYKFFNIQGWTSAFPHILMLVNVHCSQCAERQKAFSQNLNPSNNSK